MERLTRRTPAGVGILGKCDKCSNRLHCLGVCTAQDKANTRLAEYEDTGWTPAEIVAMRDELERLYTDVLT